jgi:hypothetical protein
MGRAEASAVAAWSHNPAAPAFLRAERASTNAPPDGERVRPAEGSRLSVYRYRAPISWTSSLMPGVIVALMVAPLR